MKEKKNKHLTRKINTSPSAAALKEEAVARRVDPKIFAPKAGRQQTIIRNILFVQGCIPFPVGKAASWQIEIFRYLEKRIKLSCLTVHQKILKKIEIIQGIIANESEEFELLFV